MAALTLYGTTTADATLTNACDMVNVTGGTETSKTTTFTGSNNYGEITSKGGSVATVSSIPSTPTGKGWCYTPGAGTFANATWSASVALKETGGSGDNDSLTIRFFKYSGGSYTSIGTIVNSSTSVGSSRTVVSFSTTTMPSTTFGSSDLLYVDLWWHDGIGASGDNPAAYASSTSSGVASDMQVTTSSFTASGGAVHLRICDGYGGVFS